MYFVSRTAPENACCFIWEVIRGFRVGSFPWRNLNLFDFVSGDWIVRGGG